MMRGPEQACLETWRGDLLKEARGRVVEIGAGTGANLGFYPETVTGLIAVEPSPHMSRRMDVSRYTGGGGVEIVTASAEALPLENQSVATVVCTLVMCSVPDPRAMLREIHRVLEPEGRFLFIEHVAAEDPGRLRWQQRVNPLWCRVMGGCHLTRDTARVMEEEGFEFVSLTRDEMCKAPAIVRPTIRGVAKRR